MRAKFLLFLILLGLNAPAQNYSWAHTIKGSYIPVRQTVIDQSSNVYVLGSGSELNYNGGTHQTSVASEFIAKYKADGTLEWIVPVNGDSINYYVRKIEINSNGELILAGSKEGGICFKKVNSSGAVIWYKQFTIPQSLNAFLSSFTIDADNNIIACGSFATTTCDHCSAPTDLFIYKLNDSGNIVWSRNFINNQGYMHAGNIKCDANKDIIICGSGSNLNFQGSVNQFTLNPGNFLAKYSSAGEPLWARNTDQNLEEIHLACEGTDIYAAGGFENQINMDGQTYNAAPQGSACLYKVNSSGTISWTKILGDVYAKFSSIQINKDDKTIWLSGGYSSQLNISTQSGNFSFQSPPHYGYNLDFFLLQADTSGSWKKITMIETINGQMWGSTSNIFNGKFAVGGPFWGKAVFTKANNGNDTLNGPPGNVSYDGVLAFFGNGESITEAGELNISLNKMIAYPNPLKDKLTIDPQISDTYDLEIYDDCGKSVFSAQGQRGIREYYPGSGLAPGVYFIQIRSKKCVMNTRVIIQ